MRSFRMPSLVMAILLALPLTASGPGTSYAAGETCDGRPVTIVAGPEADAAVFGTNGPDVIVVTATSHVLVLVEGGDDLVCGGSNTDVVGGEGNDTIFLDGATGGIVQAEGDAGDDVIQGGPETDIVYGGPGDDTVRGGDGDDRLSGGSGDDAVFGGRGADLLDGSQLDDLSDSSVGVQAEPTPIAPGVDTVDGGAGDDQVMDSGSSETLHGRAGDDSLYLGDPGYDDIEDCPSRDPVAHAPVLDVATETVTGFGDDTFTGFDRYVAGPETDQTIIGGPHGDDLEAGECATGITTIRGAGGPDRIATDTCHVDLGGGTGRDDIAFVGSGVARSGAQDDTVTMSRPSDFDCGGGLRLDMGRGDDSLVLPAFAVDWTTVDLHRGFAGGPNTDRVPLSGVENVHQQPSPYRSGPETLIGTDGPNILIGGDADTVLRGRGGADVLLGGHGHDTAWGGTGRDRCRAEVRHECEAH